MAFYIKSSANTYYFKEDGTKVPDLVDGSFVGNLSDAKSYSTEAAAQADIDANPSWIATAKSNGETFSVEEFTD